MQLRQGGRAWGWPWIAVVALAGACAGPETGSRDEAAEKRAVGPGPSQEGSQGVTLSNDAMRAAGIQVVPASSADFLPRITATGVIRPDAQETVNVRVPVAGRMMRVLVDVGSRVRAGQTLAVLEGPEVTATIARYRTAAARDAAARKSLDRAERLLELKGISRAERDSRQADAEAAAAEAEAARQDLRRLGLDPATASGQGLAEYRVVAPRSGTIIERSVAPGALVDKDGSLFVEASLAHMWALLDVYEKDLGRIQEHGEVEIRSDAYPGETFKGRIAFLEPAVDEAGRIARLRVVLDNSGGRLRPGLLVTGEIPLQGPVGGKVTTVPVDALQKIAGLPAVFVENAPGRFELRSVETGREIGGRIEIRRGLGPGDQVVVEGAFVLKSELLKKSFAAEDER